MSYSLGNEDWQTEQAALNIQPTDRLLCITASGDRPLNLLSKPLKEIVAVDANPVQNALCELKRSALSRFDYDEYLGFLGVTHHHDRLSLFHQIKTDISDKALTHLHAEKKKIEQGILFQGTIERLLLNAYKALRPFTKKNIDKLFSFETMEEQRAFIENEWSFKKWRKLFNLILNNSLATRCLGDPGLYQETGFPLKVGDYIYTRLEKSLMSFPVKENIIVSMLFKGQLYPEAYAPYLTREGSAEIKKQLHQISFVSENVIHYLENSDANSFDAFSLSDIASYMPQHDFERLLKAIVRTAKPNARFSIREFLSLHHFPKSLQPHFKRNHELENELEEKDRCFLYRFKVGQIQK